MEPKRIGAARVQHQFDRMSKAYASSPSHAKGKDLEWLVTLARPQADMRVLDVATGAGHTALALAGNVAAVVASDIAPQMLERVSELARHQGHHNVIRVVAGAEDLPFPNDEFDLVTCRLAAHHFESVRAFLGEVARVLQPGGRLALEDSCAPEEPNLDDFINKVERLRDPTHGRSLTQTAWFHEVAAAGLSIAEHGLYRKSRDIQEWLDRSGTQGQDRERVLEFFRAASAEARQRFDIQFDGRTPKRYSDDKIIFIAVKP